ncbi:MAG: lactoylglutathione lyase [Sphingobium sp.]|nr:lactoylglutathione lyase [Sphingobium sp.]
MNRMIFVNLPVTDLQKSIAFYEAIGGTADQHFRDENTQMMRISDEICVMLLTHERFQGFTPRRIPNAHETAQVLLCLSAGSRDEVDAMTLKAGASGGEADPNPKQDHGFMYGRSFADPDGHIWELAWMDMAAAMGGAEAAA